MSMIKERPLLIMHTHVENKPVRFSASDLTIYLSHQNVIYLPCTLIFYLSGIAIATRISKHT